MEWFLVWIVLSVVVGVVASSKGRSGFGFFLLSLILSPLIGLILAVAMPKNEKNAEAEALRSGDYRKCPMCAEAVKVEAVKCRYCGSDLSPTARPETPAYKLGKSLGRVMK